MGSNNEKLVSNCGAITFSISDDYSYLEPTSWPLSMSPSFVAMHYKLFRRMENEILEVKPSFYFFINICFE